MSLSLNDHEPISGLVQGPEVTPQAANVTVDIPTGHISNLTTFLEKAISREDISHITKFTGQLIESMGIVGAVDFTLMAMAKFLANDTVPEKFAVTFLKVSGGLIAAALGYAIDHYSRKRAGVNQERVRNTVRQLHIIARNTNDQAAIGKLQHHLNHSEKRASIYTTFSVASGILAASYLLTGLGLMAGGAFSSSSAVIRASLPTLMSTIPAIIIGSNLDHLSKDYNNAADVLRSQLQALENRDESDNV